MRPSTSSGYLFLRHVTLPAGGRVLLLNSDDLALARWLADAAAHVTAFHTSHRALAQLAMVPELARSDVVFPASDAHGPAEVALLALPKGRAHARAFVWTTLHALRPGGHLYLAGANAAGARSAIKDAAVLCGAAPVLGHKDRHRLAIATRPETLAYPADWGSPPPWEPHPHTITRPEGTYTVMTMPGVFSWEHLDDGTALLLDHLRFAADSDVLDIGCGYGILGLAAARAGARVTLVDDHLLAVRCARASAAANGLSERCTVLASDVTRAVRDQRFDRVVSNPPFYKGIDVTAGVTRRIVHESFDVLRRGGRLVIVTNRFLPYDRTLREVFGAVHTVTEMGRFRVLEAVRR
jgi:16S rRNA (guanine1207-N2)-methyltransferase